MKKSAYDKHRKDQLLARIKAAGIPVAVPAQMDELPPLYIRQDSSAYDSRIFDVNGGVGLILPLRVVPNMQVFSFSGVAIRFSRWPNSLFIPLEENDGEEWQSYQFHGRSDLKFARREAINSLIANHSEIRGGHSVRGLLLAFSHEPMPDGLTRGEILSGSIALYDQWEHEHSAKISVRVDREAERGRKPSPNPKRKSLFDSEEGNR